MIAEINAAGFTFEDLDYFTKKHAERILLLRTVAATLMTENKLSIYQAEKEIMDVLADKNQTYAGDYKKKLIEAEISYIEWKHVFYPTHVNAIDAMVSISHVSPQQAVGEVSSTIDSKLKKYPEEAAAAKKILIAEGIKYFKEDKGSPSEFRAYILELIKQPSKIQVNKLFIENLITEEFLIELMLQASTPVTAETLVAPLNQHLKMMKSRASTTPQFVNYMTAYKPVGNAQIAPEFLLSVSEHVLENQNAYFIAMALIAGIGVFYVTGGVKKSLQVINGIFSKSKISKKSEDREEEAQPLLKINIS